MKTAIYVRVSTQEQAQEGYSIGAQTDRLKAYCSAKGWLVAGVYTDAGYSGSNTQRPALERLLEDVKAGLIDCVLVYKLDRLSRSQKDTLMLIEDSFLAAGVDFVSMSENFDTSTPLGRAMVGILSVFAQLEREQIRERMELGRAERAKQGLWHGGGWDPFGYKYVDGHLVVDPIEAEIVRETYELFLSRLPVYGISIYLSKKYGRVITVTIITSILKTQLYTGVIVWHGEVYPGQHEAIIDEESFQRAQALMNDRRRLAASKPDPFKPKNIFTSFLVCANCGATYYVKGNYSGRGANRYYRPYYTCNSRGKSAPKRIIDPSCRNPSYHVPDLDKVLMKDILRLAKSERSFNSVMKANKKAAPATGKERQKNAIKKRLDSIDSQIHRVLDMYQLGTIDVTEIKQRIEALEKEKAALEESLNEHQEHAQRKLSPATARTLLDNLAEIADSGDVDSIRDILCDLIVRIDVLPERGKFNIVWNF
jgi:site-specific DNA recombinase